MLIEIKRLLKRYAFLDLFRIGLYEILCLADRFWSTTVFRSKLAWQGGNCGENAKVWGRVLIHRFPESEIKLGSGVRIISRPFRYAQNIYPQSKLRTMMPSARILIGDKVGFNSISILARSQTISIGDETLIGGNCQIMDTDGHPLWPPELRSHYPGSEHDAPVKIGKNVFIGLNVIVLKGSEIGDNSVIGAGSVVSGRIPPNCVATGVPARVIRTMTSDSG